MPGQIKRTSHQSGMNFKFMPKPGRRGGHLVVWNVTIAAAAAVIAYFRKKEWLRGSTP